MKPVVFSLLLFSLLSTSLRAQKGRADQPAVLPCDCHFKMDSSYAAIAPEELKGQLVFQNKIDSSFQTECGYLLVPENRKKQRSGMIRLPFIILRSKNPDKKKDPVLFTSGGPGNSSLGWINGMQNSLVIRDRDCIAFEQRGTRFALPYLRLFELDEAMKQAYRKNLPKDSMWLEGVKRYKKKLEQKGIDLAGYNSDESVADILDLLQELHIDSVNLFGGSYSGGLMMAVVQKDPKRIRSLVLDSPLPMFTPIDEDEPVNFNEALRILSDHAEKDSADKDRYAGLFQRFRNYFNAHLHDKFVLRYWDEKTRDTLNIKYTKNELLDVIVNGMLNSSGLKEVPYLITEIIGGHHEKYLKPRLDRILKGYPAPDGMRMSVYCSDQAKYHREEMIRQLYDLYPYMDGYHINDVWKAVCDCWNTPPVHPSSKQPFYSSVPALIGDGEMDPACRPLYMSMIKHYLPRSQCFLFLNRSHGVGGKDFYEMTQLFLDDPGKKIQPVSESVIAY